jgi:hypothetical protein
MDIVAEPARLLELEWLDHGAADSVADDRAESLAKVASSAEGTSGP